MRARIRGIYATALTRVLLAADHEVVQPSGPIRDRFDASFGDGRHDVALETTDDRQGVGAVGAHDPVETAADLLAGTDLDAFAWDAAAPRDAVFDATVTETLGRGAVCEMGGVEGFLPYDAVDAYVNEGDDVRVQVRSPTPPWSDDWATLDTAIRTGGSLVALVRDAEGVRVEGGDSAAARELAGMTDLLSASPPAGWGIRWQPSAADVDMAALETALERAAERATDLEAALDAPVGDPGRVAAPTATAWVWFGRASRFTLDERRREVTSTMPGHHRVKAASEAASAGVDFVESLCDLGDVDGFPFDAVTRQFGPREGDRVRIDHGKPTGRRIVLGRGEVVDRDPDGTLAVRRQMTAGGTYDALGVPREDGDVAFTKFREGRWWYPTVYRDADGDRKGTYVNVCTPVECFPDAVRYVDLHVDVIKHADGRVERVDDDELDASVADGEVSEPLAEKARDVAASLVNALSEG